MFHCKYFAIISSTTLPLALIRSVSKRAGEDRMKRNGNQMRLGWHLVLKGWPA